MVSGMGGSMGLHPFPEVWVFSFLKEDSLLHASFLRLQLLLGVTSSRLCSGQRGHVTTSLWELEEQPSGKVWTVSPLTGWHSGNRAGSAQTQLLLYHVMLTLSMTLFNLHLWNEDKSSLHWVAVKIKLLCLKHWEEGLSQPEHSLNVSCCSQVLLLGEKLE